jgi:hypothetical protein
MVIMAREPLGASTVMAGAPAEIAEEIKEMKRPTPKSPGKAMARDRKSRERGCLGRRAFPPRKTRRYPMSATAGIVKPKMRLSSWGMANCMVSISAAPAVPGEKPPDAKPGRKSTAYTIKGSAQGFVTYSPLGLDSPC